MIKKHIKKNKKFFNAIAYFYDFSSFGSGIYNKIVETIKIKNTSKILDAGCGSGGLLFFLYKQKKNLKLYGIDISEKMLALANKKLEKNADLSLQNIENINFRSNSFNYILSVDAFHHYADERKAMDNFYKILDKDGQLIIVDFNFGKFWNKIFHYIEPGNRGMHSAEEFKNLFKAYKFRNIKQKKMGLFSVLTAGEK
ncbi:MAG: class I SAM-dependent methyltransferase [Nanoarchaeota archaeon]